MENVKACVELIPIFLDLVKFPKKAVHGPLEVVMVDNVPQQLNSDCGIYVASFAEYFIVVHDITKSNIDATVQRHRYGAKGKGVRARHLGKGTTTWDALIEENTEVTKVAKEMIDGQLHRTWFQHRNLTSSCLLLT
ncbi:Unknown protein [Striga hermonthica]|uniref:Ubiquitin-like protease family profile domain-containing protein n=1 Tax=Striga hermonthica TaxID=68872 RepID=A0A9N7R317_STRHE|nr:Unknown protein [Striga hermonthica]